MKFLFKFPRQPHLVVLCENPNKDSLGPDSFLQLLMGMEVYPANKEYEKKDDCFLKTTEQNPSKYFTGRRWHEVVDKLNLTLLFTCIFRFHAKQADC